RADDDRFAFFADVIEPSNLAEIDQHLRPRDAHVEHGHEALAAGQHLRVETLALEPLEKLDRRLDGRRGVVVKWGRFQGCVPIRISAGQARRLLRTEWK